MAAMGWLDESYSMLELSPAQTRFKSNCQARYPYTPSTVQMLTRITAQIEQITISFFCPMVSR